MTGVRHVPGQSGVFAQRFVRELSGFGDSREYQALDGDERQRPGLVFSAAAEYLETAEDREVLIAAKIIEDAALSPDGELHNYLVTELFEPWESIDPKTRAKLLRSLGPKASALHARWTSVYVPSA